MGGDEDEQPLNEMMQAIASNRNRNSEGVLQRVVSALGKLRTDPDSYGECEECGDEIPLGRLEAMPYVEFCVNCQGNKDAPKGGPTRRKTHRLLLSAGGPRARWTRGRGWTARAERRPGPGRIPTPPAWRSCAACSREATRRTWRTASPATLEFGTAGLRGRAWRGPQPDEPRGGAPHHGGPGALPQGHTCPMPPRAAWWSAATGGG